MPKRAFVLLILGFAVFAAFVGLRLLSVLYTDYLWFSSLDFHDVFITIIRTKTLALFAFGSVFCTDLRYEYCRCSTLWATHAHHGA